MGKLVSRMDEASVTGGQDDKIPHLQAVSYPMWIC